MPNDTVNPNPGQPSQAPKPGQTQRQTERPEQPSTPRPADDDNR